MYLIESFTPYSKKRHNPYCNILQLECFDTKTKRPLYFCIVHDTFKNTWSTEFYQGPNYIPNSIGPSYSRHFTKWDDCPEKFRVLQEEGMILHSHISWNKLCYNKIEK